MVHLHIYEWKKLIIEIHSLKNLGTNYNITDNPFCFVSHVDLRDSPRMGMPGKYYTNWKHLGIFKYISIHEFFCML